MEYVNLGRSGLSVSRLCLGTMNFGPLTPPAEAHAIMDHAHEIGINFFDTANRYGGAQSPPGQLAQLEESHAGWTEEIIGDWFAGGGGRRERTVLATKLYGAMGDWPNEGRLSALNIRRACDASLRRLRTDHIDLYQMHHIDRDTMWDEIWQAMEVLVAQGKIIYVGSSNFAGWHIAQANDTAAARGFFGLVSEQSIYNLLTREIELEVLPAAIEYGVGVIPWSPLDGGLLGGVLRKERSADAGMRRLAGRALAAGSAPAGLIRAMVCGRPRNRSRSRPAPRRGRVASAAPAPGRAPPAPGLRRRGRTARDCAGSRAPRRCRCNPAGPS
jgi:aryl-alcohol dehydrogenase-like predicted oxidoreductase